MAASARQVLSTATRLTQSSDIATRLDEVAIGPEIASALLFLIAERSSDSYEAARAIQAAGEPNPVRRALILALQRLARGQLGSVVEMRPDDERAGAVDPFGYAADLLFRELLRGVIELAREGLGLSGGGDLGSDVARFERVKALSLDLTQHEDAVRVSATSTFPGPHYLASQLLRAAGTLKVAATIASGRKVLYLAPTHALVGQVERDLNARVGGLATAESVEDAAIEDILPALPTLAVITPERCFALLTFAPELFDNVGLLVFDECHLLGVGASQGAIEARKVDRRGIDAMLCLLTFLSINHDADLLLLSAMLSNGLEVAAWLEDLIGRPVHAFDDRWKPTRQLRCCVT